MDLSKYITEYNKNKELYKKMDNYYRGITDAIEEYQMITDRSNLKSNANFIKKFIKEEIAYLLDNPITYISRKGDNKIIEAITNNFAHWSKKHDKNLLKNALKFSVGYELYYTDENGFNAKLITPLNGYVVINEQGNIEMFLHFFAKEKVNYIDVYFKDHIEHYKQENECKLIGTDKHYFDDVPVGVCRLSEEGPDDTLFKDLKGTQDAYETVLSDITNEISDFRNAYLKLINCKMDAEDFKKLKKQGGLEAPKDGDIAWLIKEINDTFIQNTLSTLKENMYELSNHINANEKLQSNTSSLALRTRLINLEQKCKDNGDALTDCIINRIKFLFVYLNKMGNKFDCREINIKYTPSIPQDDLMMAQIASQVPVDMFSRKTMRAQFSFCDNPDEEAELVKSEENFINLDKVPDEVVDVNG